MGKLGISAITLWSMFYITSCSGGGGGSSAPPSPVNSAPTITSSSSLSIAENTSGVIYTATASDPDANAISYSISGADVGDFSIDASTGDLSFVSAPDFENPADADTNNVYELILNASDGNGGNDSQSLAITITDSADTRYVDKVFTGSDAQRDITYAPGLTLNVFTPAGDSATDRPVIILASGGGFRFQDPGSVEDTALDFVERGYVAATINYTVLTRFPNTPDDLMIGGLAATHDMFAAVRFFRASVSASNPYGVDGDAVFVAGESAGGVMAMIAATFDPSDPVISQALNTYLNANGGIYGNVGDNDSVSSVVQGALSLSGAILDLNTVDANSAPLYAAHEEFDTEVPCGTAPEQSSFTGLVVSGSCDVVPAYTAANASAELYLVAGSTEHVKYSLEQREEIYRGAATLFFNTVISN